MRARLFSASLSAVAGPLLALACMDGCTGLRKNGAVVDDAAAVDAAGDTVPIDDGGGDGADARPSWLIYTFTPFVSINAWSQAPLAHAWAGANAPPPRDVVATTMLSRFRRLFVVSAERRLYELGEDDVWRAPRDVDQVFPVLSGRALDAVVHVESAPNDDAGVPFESLYWFSGADTFVYEVQSGGAVKYQTQAKLVDVDGGPPRGSAQLEWAFVMFDDSLFGKCTWATYVFSYAGTAWHYDACDHFTPYAPPDLPPWAGKPGAPDFSRVRAAYVDTKAGTYNLIVEP